MFKGCMRKWPQLCMQTLCIQLWVVAKNPHCMCKAEPNLPHCCLWHMFSLLTLLLATVRRECHCQTTSQRGTPCDLQAVLRQHSNALTQATLSILKTETLTGQELKDIMAQHPPQDPPHGQVSWAPHKAVYYHVHPTLCIAFLSKGIVGVANALFGLVVIASCAGCKRVQHLLCPAYLSFCSPNM